MNGRNAVRGGRVIVPGLTSPHPSTTHGMVTMSHTGYAGRPGHSKDGSLFRPLVAAARGVRDEAQYDCAYRRPRAIGNVSYLLCVSHRSALMGASTLTAYIRRRSDPAFCRMVPRHSSLVDVLRGFDQSSTFAAELSSGLPPVDRTTHRA